MVSRRCKANVPLKIIKTVIKSKISPYMHPTEDVYAPHKLSAPSQAKWTLLSFSLAPLLTFKYRCCLQSSI